MTACLRFAIANPNDFVTSQTRETLAEILLDKKALHLLYSFISPITRLFIISCSLGKYFANFICKYDIS